VVYFQTARYPTSLPSTPGRLSGFLKTHFSNWAAGFCTSSEAPNKFGEKEKKTLFMGDIRLL